MAIIETWLNQDINEAVKVRYIDGNMFSMDNGGNRINVTVMDGDSPATLSGTVSANVIRSDGSTVAVTGTYSGNTASVVLPQSCYVIPGVISIVVKITDSTTVTTIAAVVANVYQSSTDSVVDPGTIIPSIETLIAQIEAAVATIPADYSNLWSTIAPNYANLSFPVYTGNLCTYDGHLYRAKGDIASSESWTSSHWEQTDIANNIADVRNIVNRDMFVPGDNILAASDFDTTTDANVTYTESSGKITVTNGSTNTYACIQTSDELLAKLTPGRTYRFHARCSVESGNAIPILTAKAGNNFVNPLYVGMNGYGAVDFVMSSSITSIAMLVAWGSSSQGSVVSFDELWVKEMANDYVARAEISDLKSAINNYGIIELTWEQGRYSATGTHKASSTYTIRSNLVAVTPGDSLLLTMDSNHAVTPVYWDSSMAFIEIDSNNYTNRTELVIGTGVCYVSFNYRKAPTDTSDIIYPSYGYQTVSILRKTWVFDSFLRASETLPTGTDVDTLSVNGYWYVSASYSYTHLPDGMTNGFIENKSPINGYSNVIMQIAYSRNKNRMYYRYKVSTGFVSDWVCINDDETIPNIIKGVSYTEGKSISESGNITDNVNFHYSDLIPVTVNETYTFVTKSNNVSTPTNRILAYDSEGTFIEQITSFRQPSGDTSTHIVPFVPNGNTAYIRISISKHNTNNALYLGYQNQGYACTPSSTDDGKLLKSFSLVGKKLSILGASISTYEGYIPDGYSIYYPHESSDKYKVVTVHDTYWQKVIDATGMVLLVNNSSAGSYCTTGHGSDDKAGCGTRCEALGTEDANPDIIIIQLGGNDFSRNTPLGTYDGNQDFPTDTSIFRDAYAIMLNKITEKYPSALVLCGTIPPFRTNNYTTSGNPVKNLDGNGQPNILMEDFNKAIREISALFGCQVVEFSRCGLTASANNIKTYRQDSTSTGMYGNHPNRFGHNMMANEVLRVLGQTFGNVYPNY